MRALSVFIVSVAHVTLPQATAQENARGVWRATNTDCFIQSFVLNDRAMASVSYSNGTREQRARWTWGNEGLNIIAERGVLLMDGHYEDIVLVAEVDYSTTDDVDFRSCGFTR